MVFLIVTLLLVVLFLRISLSAVCYGAAFGVLLFGIKAGLGAAQDKAVGKRTLLWTAVIVALLVGIGVLLRGETISSLLIF